MQAFAQWIGWPVAIMLLIGLSACTTAHPQSAVTPPVAGSSDTMVPRAGGKKGGALPRPDHIVVVILENEHRSNVIGSGRRRTSTSWRAGGQPDPLLRYYPSQPAELSGAVLRIDPRGDQQRVPPAIFEC